jgi:hypothetical protein
MGGTEVVASPVGGDGSKAWSVTTGDDGLFSIEVPPGTYTIGAYVDGGHGGYIGPQLVIVKVGEKVEVNLALRFP